MANKPSLAFERPCSGYGLIVNMVVHVNLIGRKGARSRIVFTDVGSADTHGYEWDFGDGVTTSGDAASMYLDTRHIFGQSGLFDITVSVTDNDGGVDSASG